ncbi:Protein VACUOLELESS GAMETOPHYTES [Cardamine amara subsp. amara]|uniref:Protein VACUOLELESS GAMETOPHYTES n=1 Tax=Cardamine amara subsp. amara TaxID=228776 RepID=A0ABD0ZPR4_CARAN
MDLDSESKLISLITQLMSFYETRDIWLIRQKAVKAHIIEIISLMSSMDLDSLPKPESEFMSVITQTISISNSMDLDSMSKVISRITYLMSPIDFDSNSDSDLDSEFDKTLDLAPEPELLSLIYKIFSLVSSMTSKWEKLISLRPQLVERLDGGKFCFKEDPSISYSKWACLPINWKLISFTGEEEDATHFICRACYGQKHKEHNNAPVVIKHPHHPKHSLQLVMLEFSSTLRECYCCDEDLQEIFYYCSACDFAMNVACVEKPPVLSIAHPKWHEHTLVLFARFTSLTCDVCALASSTCPLYICPPCGFVVHRRCINLPRVIRISRHPHRISFTPSFDQGDWSCGVCRRKIHNDYGGYSCTRNGCSYAAHSRCATQSNVWDGKDLEGEPEEDIEEVDPFVRISDGIIQHFSHQHHHLRLDENSCSDYDEDKLCQACITPIYFGNFYSCMQCDFILHEECANLSRHIYHPIHPHMLTLVGGYEGVTDFFKDKCSACYQTCKTGFFYDCGEKGCSFQLHVQCATISEPLVHESHVHPLFLTSKPEEKRTCLVCKKVRYKHDKHILTLSYGEETSTMTYWCEVCEREINPKKRFYMCDENCCVTLHIDCVLGMDLYMKPGPSWFLKFKTICNLPNDHHMSRPVCSKCKKRCPQKVVFQHSGSTFPSLDESYGSIYCSISCIRR